MLTSPQRLQKELQTSRNFILSNQNPFSNQLLLPSYRPIVINHTKVEFVSILYLLIRHTLCSFVIFRRNDVEIDYEAKGGIIIDNHFLYYA